MKTLILFFVKKYAIRAINDLLEKHKDDVVKISSVMAKWIERLEKTIVQLKTINQRVSDGILTEDEVKASTKEIEQLIKEF